MNGNGSVASDGDTSSSSSSSSSTTNFNNNNAPSSLSSSSSSSSSPLIPRILSGSIGSIVTALAATPLEVVKIRQQSAGARTIAPTSFRGVKVEPCPGCGTLVLNNGLMECVLPIESTSLRSSSSAARATLPSNNTATSMPGRTGGTFSTLVSIFRNEGYSGIYAGLRPTLAMSVPNTVLYFTAYDELSARLKRHHANAEIIRNDSHTLKTREQLEEEAKHAAYIPLLAGSSARLLASLVTAPLELIRTRQASFVGHSRNKPASPPGMMEEFRLLTRTNGYSSLYVGVAPTLWRDVPFSALYWFFLERFRNSLGETEEFGAWGGGYYRDRGMELPPGVDAMHAFASGAAAGSIAAAFTTPFDVVKTRRQMVGGQQAAEPIIMESTCDHNGLKELCKNRTASTAARSNNMGTFGHMQQIMQNEGMSGLWKGNLTRMVKVAPACAIMISCYEFGKRLFGEVVI